MAWVIVDETKLEALVPTDFEGYVPRDQLEAYVPTTALEGDFDFGSSSGGFPSFGMSKQLADAKAKAGSKLPASFSYQVNNLVAYYKTLSKKTESYEKKLYAELEKDFKGMSGIVGSFISKFANKLKKMHNDRSASTVSTNIPTAKEIEEASYLIAANSPYFKKNWALGSKAATLLAFWSKKADAPITGPNTCKEGPFPSNKKNAAGLPFGYSYCFPGKGTGGKVAKVTIGFKYAPDNVTRIKEWVSGVQNSSGAAGQKMVEGKLGRKLITNVAVASPPAPEPPKPISPFNPSIFTDLYNKPPSQNTVEEDEKVESVVPVIPPSPPIIAPTVDVEAIDNPIKKPIPKWAYALMVAAGLAAAGGGYYVLKVRPEQTTSD